MQLRLGTFKLNWVAIDVSFFFVLGFILYFGGYAHFLNLYLKMYYQAGDSPLKSIQWFLVGWPIVMLLVTIGLCLLASFESRQLLLAVSAPIILGILGFILIAAWVGANMARFKSEGGWEECQPDPRCSKLKSGVGAFVVGGVFCILAHFGQLVAVYLRIRALRSAEANYAGLHTEDYVSADLGIKNSGDGEELVARYSIDGDVGESVDLN